MKIGFLVNDTQTEKAGYTTTRLALAARRLGHEGWHIGVGDLGQDPSGHVFAHAATAADCDFEDRTEYLENAQSTKGVTERICVDDLDVLMMRNDPADDTIERPWAVTAGVLFGQLAVARGVLVVNDPSSLANAINKTYFQHFPEAVRPKTLISRDIDDIRSFVDDLGGEAVLKPLQGSGGSGVFVVNADEAPNLNQIVDAILRDGYLVAQEYLPEAAEGDVRMFVMNGEPLQVDGRYAALRRVNETDDIRSNVSAGGKVRPVEVTEEMLSLVELVRPKLREDGMFLVGLDIVGDKLMEINVFSPGGLGICQSLYDVDYVTPVIESLAAKCEVRTHYHNPPSNAHLATY